jgi:hypothetical protein
MADLDVEIDVPDDDDLGEPVRVLGGGWVPPWLKALAVLVLGAVLTILVGAFLLGRARAGDDGSSPSTQATSIESVEASPAISSALAAIEVWETFARTGDLTPVASHFDPNGPQYALFAEQAERAETADLELTARNLSEAAGSDTTTVSLELAVTGADGEAVYPYDLVYLDGSVRVWTVIDRREPGSVALPPAQATIDLATASWATFASAVAAGDGAGASQAVSERTRQLANGITAAIANDDRSQTAPLTDPELFGLLVDRASAAGVDNAEGALLSLLDQQQRDAIASGALGLWTQTDPERVIASLEVEGQPVATVPFIASTGGWVFDLAGALETSQGESA